MTATHAQAWEGECGLQEGHDLTLWMELTSPGKDVHEWKTIGGTAAALSRVQAARGGGGKRKQFAPELERILDVCNDFKLNPKIFTDGMPPPCCNGAAQRNIKRVAIMEIKIKWATSTRPTSRSSG